MLHEGELGQTGPDWARAWAPGPGCLPPPPQTLAAAVVVKVAFVLPLLRNVHEIITGSGRGRLSPPPSASAKTPSSETLHTSCF